MPLPLTTSPTPFAGLRGVSPMPELCCSVRRTSCLLEHVVLAQLAQTPRVRPITLPHPVRLFVLWSVLPCAYPTLIGVVKAVLSCVRAHDKVTYH